jgi:hypothetical protein
MVTEVVTTAIRGHEERFDSKQARALEDHDRLLNLLEAALQPRRSRRSGR